MNEENTAGLGLIVEEARPQTSGRRSISVLLNDDYTPRSS